MRPALTNTLLLLVLQKTSSKVTYALLRQTVLLLRTQLRKLITLECLMVARIPLQTDLISIANIGQLAQTATNIVAYLYDDPYTVFRVQSAGTTAQTNIGNCADVVAGAGSTTTGQSGFELSGTMAAGIATCKILALYDAPDNAFGANAIMEVTINEHLLGTNVAGI
jgi:hypothetical protein